MLRYKSIRNEASVERIIEKSRFIAYVRPVKSKEEAVDFFDEIRNLHRTATHNVPAYVIGENNNLQWTSDDGEPQGTSGPPILQMLIKEGITDVAVIVTRYFGGIKLGTGGLVRAYTGVAKEAIDAAKICNVCEMNIVTIRLDYSCLGKLKNLADGSIFSIDNIIYQDQIIVDLRMEPEKHEKAMAIVSNLTGGKFIKLKESQELVKT
jgi:uncharacterized YigZ family protein